MLQKCTDSNFCNRLRGVRGPAFEVLPKSVDVRGQAANAKLLETQSKAEYDLSLTAYNGVLRLRVSEPAKNRFEVPDILQPKFLDAPADWTTKKASSKSLLLQLGNAALTLDYQPFKLSLAIGGKPAIEVNERSLFGFEHLRQKKVRGMSAEHRSACRVQSPLLAPYGFRSAGQ